MVLRFARLFWRQVVRQAWRHPLLTGLNILGIALGITVFLAVQIANRGAIASFQAAAELTTGRAHLEIRGNLDDDILPTIAAFPGVKAATPIVEGVVTFPDAPGEYLRILGVDPFTGREVFPFQLQTAGSSTLDLEKWLADPDVIAVQTGFTKTGSIQVLAGTMLRTLRPAFAFKPDAFTQTDPRLAAMDIGWAQELFGSAGRISSILVLLDEPSEVEAVADGLRKIVPADARVALPAARSEEMKAMLGAFQLNVTAMSLVSLVVGMFLICNSVGASVIRRRVDIAILRANGATRGEVRRLFLCEAALEAAVGVALGIWLAPLLAGWIAQPVSQSISSLYELVRVENTSLTDRQMLEAIAIGMTAALVAAWLPASEAAHCDPARILHPGAGIEVFSPLHKRGLVVAILLIGAAFGLCVYSLEGGSKYLGFAAAGAIIAGFSLLVPWLALAVAFFARNFGVISRLAANHFARSLHRNTLTIAALAAAIAMTISVTVMIHSFRASVQRWIERTLTADLYIAPAVNEIAGSQALLPDEAQSWAEGQPDVLEVGTFRELPIRFRDQPTTLAVINGKARGKLEFLAGEDAEQAFQSGECVAVSESFASRFGVEPRAVISLPTPAGIKEFTVCGVYKDFARDRGTILMHRTLFDRYWHEGQVHSLALKMRDPALSGPVGEAFRARFGHQGQFVLYDNAALRQRVFEIFDETFAVTSVLRGIAIIVAVAGVLFSLSALVIEREREIGVLRAMGASRTQVLGVFLTEAALLGFTSALSGLASGGALAMVLTWIINKAFFGWTIDLNYPALPLVTTPLWIVGVAFLAALLPAWRAANIAPARAVRFE
ncbi:MAG TPA: FtsX-like permease family protein [Terrimicrobiaceae bacterium]